MDHLEADLRDELARQAAAVPSRPQLAEAALARGRRARQRRRAALAAAGAGVVALSVAAASAVLPLRDRAVPQVAAVSGAPRVPLFVAQGTGELIDWVGGERRSRPLGESTLPVAQVPAGLLVLTGLPVTLGLLGPQDEAPRPLVRGLDGQGVAVSSDGGRATVALGGRLVEVALPTGRELRSVALGPLAGEREQVLPTAYSGGAVLVTVGEGQRQRALLWEAGDDQVVAALDGFEAVLDGADADLGPTAVGGRAAFRTDGDRCRTAVVQLRDGDGSPWQLCREPFGGFSPGGRWVLATDATGNGLVVRDAADGDLRREFDVPEGLRAHGWESADTLLYTTVDGDRTVVVRCSVRRGRCVEAAGFAFTDRIPEPVRPAG